MLGYLEAIFSQLGSYLTAFLDMLLSYRVIKWPLSFLGRLWSFRVLRWPFKLLLWTSIISNVFDMSLWGLEAFGILDVATVGDFIDSNIEYLLPSSDPVPDFSSTNLFRELPDDPAVLAAIKETQFLDEYLGDMLLPTSLPTDDYSLLSDYLRNIETRTDLTWLVLQESGLERAVLAVAQRRDSVPKPLADEPFELQKRFKALHTYWTALAQRDDKPQSWQVAFDTVSIPPILKAQPLAMNGAGDQALLNERQQQNKIEINMTAAQQASSDLQFNYYLATRSYKVSYLRTHPPKPMGYAPVAKQPFALRSTWDKIFTDGIIEAGRSISFSQLANNDEWRPMYGSLDLQRVPWTWVQEGNEEGVFGGVTQELFDLHMAAMTERIARQTERRAVVEAWQSEIRPEREARQKEEYERMEREWKRKEEALAMGKQDL